MSGRESMAGRAQRAPAGHKGLSQAQTPQIPQIPAPEPLLQPPLTSQAGSARIQSMSSSELGQ